MANDMQKGGGKQFSKAATKIRTVYGISEYRLGNGLRVLFKRHTGAPVVAVCITYHVGSRNEAPGHTGATHILEHLMFKDAKRHNEKNGKSIKDYLEWFGASINATTWVDRTNYFELLPKKRLAEALALEADRMRDALFNTNDLASEMTVVRNEYERSRNNPFELLDEEVTARAFTVHPYRIPTIGTKEDIEGATVEKLREFYDTYYWPNNATLAIIGDVSWKEAGVLVEKYFGKIPSSRETIPGMDIIEPVQKEARHVEIRKPLGLQIVEVGYKVPAATHPDHAAIQLAGGILAGGFGSRLRRAVVDSGLAADISLSCFSWHDPSLLTITAHVADHADPKRVLSVIRREVARMTKEAPRAAELARARERMLSEYAVEMDGAFAEVRTLSEGVAAGDWTLPCRAQHELEDVGPTDILRIARAYFHRSSETAGILYKNLSKI